MIGLNWITPRIKNKKEAILEIEHLNDFKNILKKDKEKKNGIKQLFTFFSLT